MTGAEVVAVLTRLDEAGIPYWLDGGWGVDALVGEETRVHDDLDVVIRLEDADEVVAALCEAGFEVTSDQRPMRFVLEDGEGQKIDLHPVVFDVNGDAKQIGAGPKGSDAPYPSWGFDGEGTVAGHTVRCLSPRLLLWHHTGYEPQDKDRHNVRVLCETFGLPRPSAY